MFTANSTVQQTQQQLDGTLL